MRARHRFVGLVAGIAAGALLGLGVGDLWAKQAVPPERLVFSIRRASGPVKIDGSLDEAAWRDALKLDLKYEVDPGDNLPAPVRTEAYLMYDQHFLYVGFRAFDPEPKQIRAHLSDRDAAFRDDFVGIMLDPFNDARRGVELFVNPVGVQMDLSINEVGTGDSEDASWDAIWDSAARITSEGYEAEMAIPFTALRFPGNPGPQTWGFMIFRAYPRTVRHQLTILPFSRDRNCSLCQYPRLVGFEGIRQGRNIEIVPTLTASRSEDRGDEITAPLAKDSKGNLGVSARWGVTPSLSLNAALKPDFSQVEADAAQLTVNTRYALFYNEKRPFFLEGADFFGTPIDAVYTRTVADPTWGIKLTGKEGAHAVGAYVASDRITNLILPSNQGSSLVNVEQKNTAGAVRYRVDLGETSTLGVLATDREGDGYHNRVFGLDTQLRFGPADTVRLQALHSDTLYPARVATENDQPVGSFADKALFAQYSHDARFWSWWLEGRDLGKEFRADTGFVPRVDTRIVEVGFQRYYWGTNEGWFNRLAIGVDASRTTDHSGILTNQNATLLLNYNGPWQSYGFARLGRDKEYYKGVTYDLNVIRMFGNIRPTGNFTCSLFARLGGGVDYDNARSGSIYHFEPGFTYNLGRHLYIQYDGVFEWLTIDAGRVYRADLSQARLIYQFTARAFLRGTIQYTDVKRTLALYTTSAEPTTRRLFGQLLFSYKINPQTVFFLGYSDNGLAEQGLALTRLNRSLFMKIGYDWMM